MAPPRPRTKQATRPRARVAAVRAEADAPESQRGGVQSLGLAENGVDWALDEHNRSLITPEVEAAAKKAKDEIAAGTLKVHDYMSDDKCPL